MFNLESRGRTIKQYLGEKEALDEETQEILKTGRVPRQVYTYLRFLAARDIQRKRHYLFLEGHPSPTTKFWRAKLRDDTRRRLRNYLLGLRSAPSEIKVESTEDNTQISRLVRKKIAAKARGENFNQIIQRRKRSQASSAARQIISSRVSISLYAASRSMVISSTQWSHLSEL